MNSDIVLWRKVGMLEDEVDFAAWFGNDHPVEIEIGCGKGGFIAASAERRPDINFVGIEVDGTYLKLARQKIEKRGLTNVRLLHGDMVYFLFNHLREKTVQVFHVYFPDPWPKRRHAKRRMFRDVSAEQFARTLVPGGRLIMKTDVPVSFIRIRRVMRDSHLFDLEEMRVWRGPSPLEDNIPTNFETKYARTGKEVFYARWKVKK